MLILIDIVQCERVVKMGTFGVKRASDESFCPGTVLSLGRSETVKNGSRRAKTRFGDSQLNLVRKIAFRSFKGSNDSALLASLNILRKSQSSNHSRTGLACLEPFLTVSDRPRDRYSKRESLLAQPFRIAEM